MKISICPKCYEKGEITEGKFLNSVYAFGVSYVVYHCEKCKDSYREN